MLTAEEGDGSIGNTEDCSSASTQRRGGSRVLHCAQLRIVKIAKCCNRLPKEVRNSCHCRLSEIIR